MRIRSNYHDPHHLNSSNKKKKDHHGDDDKDKKKEEQDIIIGGKDEETKAKIQKTNINGHEWITFKNIDADKKDEDGNTKKDDD